MKALSSAVKLLPYRWGWTTNTRFLMSGFKNLRPWPWRYDCGLRSWHILGSWTTIVILYEIISKSNIHQLSLGLHCDIYLVHVDMAFVQSYDTLLFRASWITIVWNIIQIQQGVKKLWPRQYVNKRTVRHGDWESEWVIKQQIQLRNKCCWKRSFNTGFDHVTGTLLWWICTCICTFNSTTKFFFILMCQQQYSSDWC